MFFALREIQRLVFYDALFFLTFEITKNRIFTADRAKPICENYGSACNNIGDRPISPSIVNDDLRNNGTGFNGFVARDGSA